MDKSVKNSIDQSEVAKFEAMANQWWDKQGKFKPLHMLNPTRIDYILQQIIKAFQIDINHAQPLKGLRILDIGCGGGLLSEPMSRLGAEVVGADAAVGNISVARLHARQSGLNIDYRHTTAEDLLLEDERFDVILNMEVIEHVADPQLFINSCGVLLNTNGLMICTTINRNLKSYLFAIIGAERVMRWLPVGTHLWRKFIKPSELTHIINSAGLKKVDNKGFSFNLFRWNWSISTYDLSVNYAVACTKNNGILK